MGIECGEETRKHHPGWCSLLDGLVGAVWAAAPDAWGVAAVGTAALDTTNPTTYVSIRVLRYNQKMADEGKNDNIDPGWAQQHPMEALRELKQRGY